MPWTTIRDFVHCLQEVTNPSIKVTTTHHSELNFMFLHWNVTDKPLIQWNLTFSEDLIRSPCVCFLLHSGLRVTWLEPHIPNFGKISENLKLQTNHSIKILNLYEILNDILFLIDLCRYFMQKEPLSGLNTSAKVSTLCGF